METPQKQHSTRKHSDFAASSSHRWLNCPGGVKLCKKAPPQVESSYAKEGTDAHECLEFVVRRFSNIEKALQDALKKWPEEMVKYAEMSAKKIYELKPSRTAKLLVETRVILKQIGPGLFGTLDYAWVDQWGKLIVIDYKYGQGVAVFPTDEDGTENSQLMYYAAGIAHKYDYEFDEVELVIIQPRVWSDDGEIHRSASTTIGRVKKFEKQVKIAVALSKTPEAPLKAGNWCRWCPAASFCPEISENQLRQADILFEPETAAIQAIPEPKALTAEYIPKLLDACDLLETWIEKVRERAFELASKGEKIKGRKLVQKRSTRVWLPDAEKEACKLLESPYNRSFMSPAQIEKYAKEIGMDKEAIKSFTEKFTTSLSSGVTLVPESDKRPEVKEVNYFE